MKNLLAATAFAAIFSAGFAQIALAAPMAFGAVLLGTNEVPSNASSGTGDAVIIIDPVANTMLVDVTFSGLLGNTTASHIHCCLASPGLTGVLALNSDPLFDTANGSKALLVNRA